MTAVAMVFAPADRMVEATLVDGSVQVISLHRLGAREARRARLERFRYTAFAVPYQWCVRHMESRNAAGNRLWRSGDIEAETCEHE